LALAIAVPFSLLAGTMAGLIAFQEYAKHFRDRRQPLEMALRTAGATVLFFFLLTVGVVLVVGGLS
jgi:hypothetical protein